MKILPLVLPASHEAIKKTGVINVGRNIDLVETGDYKKIDFFKVGKSGYAKHQYNGSAEEGYEPDDRDQVQRLPGLVERLPYSINDAVIELELS